MTTRTLLLSAASIAGLLVSALVAPAGDWPQWRGVNRDGKSTDTSLLKQWPADGPQLLWKAGGLGKGFSGPAIVGARIFTMGDQGEESFVIAQSADDGKVLWSTKVGKAGAPGWGGFAGPRATPTVAGDLLVTVNQWGELVCLDAATGTEKWRRNYERDFGAKRPEWGFAESPLIDGNQVVVTPGGPRGAMIALNKQTGELLWQTGAFRDEAQYSSILKVTMDGVPQYVQLTMASVVGIAPEDGRVLWRAARKGATAVIPTPIVDGNLVYVTSGYSIGCNLFKISSSGGAFSAEQVYANKVMVNHHGGVVKVGDNLYGHSEGKGWVCQNLKTGEMVWSEKEKLKKGCVSFADGLLICREEDSGTVALLEAVPSGYVERGRFKQPDRASDKAWPHPVIANGRLYLRDQDRMFCYDLRAGLALGK